MLQQSRKNNTLAHTDWKWLPVAGRFCTYTDATGTWPPWRIHLWQGGPDVFSMVGEAATEEARSTLSALWTRRWRPKTGSQLGLCLCCLVGMPSLQGVKHQASLPLTPRPLGDVRYAWPSDSECFWESGKGARQLRVNEDTGVGWFMNEEAMNHVCAWAGNCQGFMQRFNSASLAQVKMKAAKGSRK